MCMEYKMVCRCGKREASFNFKDNIMPPDVIEALFCPDCSRNIAFDPISMIEDNGWLIKYDMEVASLYRNKLPYEDLENFLPEMLFDRGYATWRGIYPGDHIDSVREREELAKLAKVDPRRYLQEMRNWAINRMERLRKEGWRKANETVGV